MKRTEFDDLVSLWLDDALPAERASELSRLLAERPELASRFVRLGRIHGGLRELETMELEAAASCPLPAPAPRPSLLSYIPVGIAAAILLSIVAVLLLPEPVQGPTVGRAGDPEVLFVVGRADALAPGDRAMRDRLVGLGFRVTPVKDSSAELSHAEGRALVVISESTVAAELGGKLGEARAPILNCEPNLNRGLRLTTRGAGPGEVFLRGRQRRIRIADPSHPLAAGLSGAVDVYFGREGFVSWGTPDESLARVVARTEGRETPEPALFAYEAGRAAHGPDLPARRLSFFVPANTSEADRLTPEGWALFDAAVRWLAPRKP